MISSKTTLVVLLGALLLLLCNSQPYRSHQCNHGEIEQNPGLLDIQEQDFPSSGTETDADGDAEGRTLQQNSYSNIRIYPYYDYLRQTADSSFISYVQNDLIPPVVDYFQGALKVRYPVIGNLKFGQNVNSLCEMPTPSFMKTTGVPADLFLYFDSRDGGPNDHNIASTASCYLASGSKRPLVIRIMINRPELLVSLALTDTIVHETNMVTFIHEMMHGLAISPSLFPLYLDDSGRTRTGHIKTLNIAGRTRTVIDIPALTTRLRNYYGCSTVPGLILENEGGSGTAGYHPEKKYFSDEAMSSGVFSGQKVSEFSLGLVEGSGWYTVDYSYAEPYFFGQGEGCGFVNGICTSSGAPHSREYCTGSNRGCTPSGRGGGYCESDNLSEGCRIYYPWRDYDCENPNADNYVSLPGLQVFGRGAGSRCFSGTLSTRQSSNTNFFCFRYSCTGTGASTQVHVQVGSNTIVCTQEGHMSVPGYYGSVNCPDPLTYCNTAGKQFCTRNCMGRGTCVNNQCHCNSGFTGYDCSARV